jgi:hypothetical protein
MAITKKIETDSRTFGTDEKQALLFKKNINHLSHLSTPKFLESQRSGVRSQRPSVYNQSFINFSLSALVFLLPAVPSTLLPQPSTFKKHHP